MKRTELVHVAVAETSVIVRSGLVAVLKRMPDLIIQPVEITSPCTPSLWSKEELLGCSE